MKSTQPVNSIEDQPAAYDNNSQPTYPSSQAVHIVRPINPAKPIISEEIKLKNARSRQSFPELNLSENEYIITSVKRHVIGLVAPIFIGLFLIAPSIIALFNSDNIAKSFEQNGNNVDTANIALPIFLFILLVFLVVYAAYYIYTRNKFFLTNESVIQEIQTSLFSRREQTVSLANIEDSSYAKTGILQQIFNYGSIRLSTVGDENTYNFTYVINPERQIDILNNAVEAFNNGRPVER